MGTFPNDRFGVEGLNISGFVFNFSGTAAGQANIGIGVANERETDGAVVDERPFAPPGSGGRQVDFIPTDRSGVSVGTPTREPDTNLPPAESVEEEEVVEIDRETFEVKTEVVHKITDSAINTEGFIDNLSFEIKDYARISETTKNAMNSRSDKNVFVFVERFRVPSGLVLGTDYIPTTDMGGFRVFLNGTIQYNSKESDAINEIVGSESFTGAVMFQGIEALFGSGDSGVELNLENSIITNRLENTKKMKLSSVSENLPTTAVETPPSTDSEPTTSTTGGGSGDGTSGGSSY